MSRILIIEDLQVDRELLRRRLTHRGHEILLACDGREGVETARRDLPDIIIMDLVMPFVDGLEATRQIKAAEATAGIPIIALTAHALPSDRESAFAAGCDEFEAKPLDLVRLLDKIETLLTPPVSG